MNTIEGDPQKPKKKSRLFWLEKLGMKTHNRRFWSTDKFFSLFAFLISVGTFATFAYQTYLIREQQDLILKEQYASVLPYLTIYPWKNSPEDLSIKLVNNGVGPAFIEVIKIYHEGTTYNVGPAQFFQEIISSNYPEGSIDVSSDPFVTGIVIPAGQELELIGSNNKKAAEIIGELFFGADEAKTQIEITYSSVYEETWVIKLFDYVPEKLE